MNVRVRVGGEQYALAVQDVREVLELGELTPIPGARENVLGLRNLSGEILPVFDLALTLGVAPKDRPRRMLVVENRERRAGLAVDEVLDVGMLDEATHKSDAPLLEASTVIDGELVGVLRVGALLDAFAGEA